MAEVYYPVFLDVAGRAAVVIGGGNVAEGKVNGLLEAGARVTVVSPSVTSGVQALAAAGTIAWLQRTYQNGDLADAWVGIAATDDAATNMAIAEEAAKRRILVNVVDVPSLCNFIAPAIVRRDDLTIAISTNGKSPAMARRMREELERLVPPEYGALLTVVAEVRADLRRRQLSAPPDVWQKALTLDSLLELLRRGRRKEAIAKITETLMASATKSGTALLRSAE